MYQTSVTYTTPFTENLPEDQKIKVTKTLYFHLYPETLMEMEVKEQQKNEDPERGLGWRLKQITSGKIPGAEIMETFRMFVRESYGIRTEDDEFVRDPEVTNKFMRSAAYNEFFTSLVTDPDSASNFINAIMPASMMAIVEKAIAEGKISDVELELPKADPVKAQNSGLNHPLDSDGNLVPWHDREPTEKELARMDQSQLMDVFRRRSRAEKKPK